MTRPVFHLIKFLVGLEGPKTQVTDNELKCLIHYSQKARVVVELGCYEGRTTAELARNCEGSVYTVDPFCKGRLGFSYGEVIARRHIKRQGLKNIHFIESFSYQAAEEFDNSIDFLFIDADHSYEAVKQDWNDWYPKVRPGGFIALHDSRVAENSPGYMGSMQFYDEDLPKVKSVNEVDGIDSLAVVQVSR